MFISQNPFRFEVNFEDGSLICYKDDPGLRMWVVLVQRLHFEPIHGNTKHCIELPITYYDLLGFRSGDFVLIKNEQEIEMPILFS